MLRSIAKSRVRAHACYLSGECFFFVVVDQGEGMGRCAPGRDAIESAGFEVAGGGKARNIGSSSRGDSGFHIESKPNLVGRGRASSAGRQRRSDSRDAESSGSASGSSSWKLISMPSVAGCREPEYLLASRLRSYSEARASGFPLALASLRFCTVSV